MTPAPMSTELKALRLENIHLRKQGKRRCIDCRRVWQYSIAHFQKRGKVLDSRCKSCRNIVRRAYHQQRKASDPVYAKRVRDYAREFYRQNANDPLHRERWRINARRWRRHQKLRNPLYMQQNRERSRRSRLKLAFIRAVGGKAVRS